MTRPTKTDLANDIREIANTVFDQEYALSSLEKMSHSDLESLALIIEELNLKKYKRDHDAASL